VHYVSYFDFWRGKQTLQSGMPAQSETPLVKIQGAAD
jgi:hypothetical protein